MMGKRLIIIAALICSWTFATAQEKIALTLEGAIQRAQDSTWAASINESAHEKSQWDYKLFEAQRKPQVEFELFPNYVKESFDITNDYFKLRNYNMLSANADLKVSQQVNSTGGDFYAKTQLLWTEFLGESQYGDRIFGTMPVVMGYSHNLLGFNQYKWDKSLETFKFEQSHREYSYERLKQAEEVSECFFEYARCQSLCAVYENNAEIAARLYTIGKEKFALTSISRDELMSLELQMINSRNKLSTSKLSMREARSRLLSCLNIQDSGQIIDVIIPQDPEYLLIAVEDALEYAKNGNPEYTAIQKEVIKAKMARSEADAQAGLQIGLDINVGLQYYENSFIKAYASPSPFMMGSVGLKIPIVDHGMSRSRINSAKSELEQALAEENDALRSLELEVSSTLDDFNTMQKLLGATKEALSLSDETFSIIEDLYVNGESDINTFTLAQSRRDDAYDNYLSAVQRYWESYWHLCAICCHEF